VNIIARAILGVSVVCILAYSGQGTAIDSGEEEIAPNEVKVYLQSDFNGPFLSWKLDPNMRQRLIQNVGDAWGGKITSIQMGSDVGVMLFQNKYFRFTGSAYVNFNSPVKNISVRVPGSNNSYCSLIIYPKKFGSPLGLLAGNSAASDFRFFPLPENIDEATYNVADIRHLMSPVDFVLLFPGEGPNSGMAATLFSDINLKGHSITLPLQSGETRYNLSDLNFAGKAESLRIMQTQKTASLQKVQGTISQKAIRKSIPSSAIKNQSNEGTCSISGAAKGPFAERAILYSLTLYGPNDLSNKRSVARFEKSGNFIFSSLPEGRFRIVVSPDPGKADIGIELKAPKQSEWIVDCKKGEAKHITIVFDE
jgi:hypothetical protein